MRISGMNEKRSGILCLSVSWAVFLLLIGTQVSAGTIYVATCGDDANTGIDPACGTSDSPKLTIQAGIDTALIGDVIEVASGTYNEVIDLLGKAITVRGSGGAEATTIDGTGLESSVVKCINGEGTNTLIEGFAITGGSGLPCPFDTTRSCGGGVYLGAGTAVRLRSCVFRGNETNFGGGIYVFEGHLDVAGSLFKSNEVNYGGGVYSQESTGIIDHSRFKSNYAENRSGAVSFQDVGNIRLMRIENCNFSDNVSVGRAGALNAVGGELHVYNTRFVRNLSNEGGAIHAVNGTLQVTRCEFSENRAWRYGGGIYVGALCKATVDRSIFTGNLGYAAIYLESNQNSQCELDISNSLLADNEDYALRVAGGDRVAVRNCTMTGSGTTHQPICEFHAVISNVIQNSIIWDPITPSFDRFFTFRPTEIGHSVFRGVFPDNVTNLGGNRNLDPLFVSSSDYRLQSDSPCIDAGSNAAATALVTDLDGFARFRDEPGTTDTGAGTAPIVDIGAFEFGSCLDAVAGDCQGDGIPDGCQLLGNDCNNNNVPDDCDISGGIASDCNSNIVIDSCETEDGRAADCNVNDVPDVCEIEDNVAPDCNSNGLIDYCEPQDCNENDVPDDCDIAAGLEPDCNGDFVIDYCEPNFGSSNDCNYNDIPDSCEIEDGLVLDCNANQRIDECDIRWTWSDDCNLNGLPDECEIADGLQTDCDGDGVIDDCAAPSGRLKIVIPMVSRTSARFSIFLSPTAMEIS